MFLFDGSPVSGESSIYQMGIPGQGDHLTDNFPSVTVRASGAYHRGYTGP
jgi:hypothetical protein